jgi:hypothetical protein
MGEHKTKLIVGGNGDEGPKLSSHIVEVVDEPILGGEISGGSLSRSIEEAYRKLSERATREDSFILSVIQTVCTYTVEGRLAFALVVLTAQRIGREDLEKQQRLQRMQGGRAL